jgi:hypothetical protein
MASDYAQMTTADIQETARKWLVPSKAFMLVVKPESIARPKSGR